MTPIVTFVLGLLCGWLVEWAIDWIYRNRRSQAQKTREAALHQRVISLDRELVALRTGAPDPEKTRLEEQVVRLEQELAELRARQPASPAPVPETRQLVSPSSELTPVAPGLVSEPPEPVVPEKPESLPGTLELVVPVIPGIDQEPPEPVSDLPPLVVPDLPEIVSDNQEFKSNPPQPGPEASHLEPDNLTIIKGIGPAIAKKLNAAGIYTFEQLAAQTPDSLRGALGNRIERLADENNLLEQARQFAASKQGEGPGTR